MNTFLKTLRRFKFSRTMATEVECKPRLDKFRALKENQKRFQAAEGIPVHLKAGLRDKILYQFTLLGTAIGLILSGHTLYLLINPPSSAEDSPQLEK